MVVCERQPRGQKAQEEASRVTGDPSSGPGWPLLKCLYEATLYICSVIGCELEEDFSQLVSGSVN